MSDIMFFNNIILPILGMLMASGFGGAVLYIVHKQLTLKRTLKSGGDGALREEIERLKNQVAELADSSQRLAELEERLDFAERMLARSGDRPQIP